jgi:catalase
MVSGLRNVDEDLARTVAEGLGLPELPAPLPAAREPVRDLAPSLALSILANGPADFAGRTIGVLVTSGADGELLTGLRQAAAAEKARVKIIAPAIGGIETSDGAWATADYKIDGSPSVLYDAVAVLTTKEGAAMLAHQPAARDFVSDAYAHCKFLGYTDDATGLFAAAGLYPLDDGFVPLGNGSGAAVFVARCRKLRFWDRAMTPVQ